MPSCLDLACDSKPILQQRENAVPLAQGRSLEIGMDSGLNIPFYDEIKVDMVWGLKPSEGMRPKAQKDLKKAPFPVELLRLPSEQIPLDANNADTILLNYALFLISIRYWRRCGRY